ncbi:MaoC family dehydratase N-terminal domain-containing protein [Verrucosispora sp. FIM060022]|uniref:MaoC family dehydratase N-terminal domain-containing protein n=1 Tax=Verrucosispora sp. FIM060022 TaxID=1479020 RepID=UPI000F892DF0|nr:MaoC family dehydratase N-terminal domain-containing protein [Verrucosispora sp. FIM060022]RUL93690.1 MaoC family dehydratase [Verrucosispora sp. FIM060022]
MSLDQSFVGRTYPPTAPYQVGREKIREFARAIGATDSAYHDPEAARALGHPDVVAPPTFPIVLTMAANQQMIEDPDLAIDYTRVVHGDQRFAYTRPVVAGDELVCVNAIEEITGRAGHVFVTSRTEVTTTAGEPVVTAWMKLVVRGEA